MKLEKTIDQKKGILKVEATFRPRIYMSQKLDILTTERLIAILKEEHDIEVKEEDILIQPIGHRVGNSTRKNIKPFGVWEFSLPKKTTRPPKQGSVRSRMSKLSEASSKKKEETVDKK